jgi:hypothetical protein
MEHQLSDFSIAFDKDDEAEQKTGPMTLNKINLVISTVWREETYLDATLDSLSSEYPISSDHPVCLVVGSPVTTHLDCYRSHPGVTIVEMGPHAWAWIKNNNVRHRATWNYHRCLTQCMGGEQGSLVLEDDVRFARGWRLRLDMTLEALESRYDTGFVLTIYDPWKCIPQESPLYAEYPREKFTGTQGVYYPSRVREDFAKYLRVNGVIANRDHYDYLLRDYLIQEDILLFATAPSLIQHMGRNTTGLGVWHQAPGFVEDVTAEPTDQCR